MHVADDFPTVLHRYSQQDDIIVGTPIANRNRSDIEPLIGFFVNSLALRSDFSKNPTFRELLRQTRRIALDAYANQDLPFDCLVQEILPERHVSQNPLFQVLFSLDNAPHSALQLPGLTLTPMNLETDVAKFDLALNMVESASGLVGGLEYKTDLLEDATIARLAETSAILQSLLLSILTSGFPSCPCYLKANTNRSSSSGTPLNSISTRRWHPSTVRTASRAVTGCHGSRVRQPTVHVRRIEARANQLAHYLKKSGVSAGSLVGVSSSARLTWSLVYLGFSRRAAPTCPWTPRIRNIASHLCLTNARYRCC